MELFNAKLISFVASHISALTSGEVEALLDDAAAKRLDVTLDEIGLSGDLARYGIFGSRRLDPFQQESKIGT